MATLSEMASEIANKATNIGMEAATLALRLADAECKPTEPGAPLSAEEKTEIRLNTERASDGCLYLSQSWKAINAVLAKRNTNTAQPTESLADHCAKVAEQVAEMPDWKKGSAVNERTPRQFNSVAQADGEDQHKRAQPAPANFASVGSPFTSDRNPAPVDSALVESACTAFMTVPWTPKQPQHLREPIAAVVRLVQQDSNARLEKAQADILRENRYANVAQAFTWVKGRMEAESLPLTLQERITERFKTQRCINRGMWNPEELAAIVMEEIAKEAK
jgi:hypothetical protein